MPGEKAGGGDVSTMLRGSFSRGRMPAPDPITFGEPIWEKCSCGKWRDRKTKQHVELQEMNLEQFLKEHDDCLDKRNP